MTCEVSSLNSSADQIKEDRGGGHGNPKPCEHRERPIEESLREFERMRNGEYPEKAACLRMKMDLNSGNPYMWDAIAYRVKLAPHHRTGDKWSMSLTASRFGVNTDELQRSTQRTILRTACAILSKTSRECATNSMGPPG